MTNIQIILKQIKKASTVFLLIAIVLLTSGCGKAYYSQDIADLVTVQNLGQVDSIDNTSSIQNGRDNGSQDWTGNIPIQ